MFKDLCALFIADVTPSRPWVSLSLEVGTQLKQNVFYVVRSHTVTLFFKSSLATLYVPCFLSPYLACSGEVKRVLAFPQMFRFDPGSPIKQNNT